MKFLRRTSNRYSKLGKRRKKKQIWRRPTGRDNKMRERRRGYPARVSIGYKKPKKEKKVIIRNPKELEKIDISARILVGNVGKIKKIEIAKKAKEKKISLENMNIEKFLKNNQIKEKKKIEEKKTKGVKKQWKLRIIFRHSNSIYMEFG